MLEKVGSDQKSISGISSNNSVQIIEGLFQLFLKLLSDIQLLNKFLPINLNHKKVPRPVLQPSREANLRQEGEPQT